MTIGDKPTTVNFEHYAAPEVWAELDELRERNRKLAEAAAFNPPGLDRIVTATERIASALDNDREQRDRVEDTIDDFVRREAEAVEKIATALEQIAAHLAPAAVRPVEREQQPAGPTP